VLIQAATRSSATPTPAAPPSEADGSGERARSPAYGAVRSCSGDGMFMKPFSVSGFFSLFSTHPPTESRVEALLSSRS
jgi:Zn-dependent protease with chaperone function